MNPFVYDIERLIEFDFLRCTEIAALNCMRYMGKGEKEAADAAACALDSSAAPISALESSSPEPDRKPRRPNAALNTWLKSMEMSP